MDRLFPDAERNIYENQRRRNLQYKYESNRAVNDNTKSQYTHKHIQKFLANDVLLNKYNILNPQGSLNYYIDTAQRSEYKLLNKYNEPYVNNNSTILRDTLNKADIYVSGYYFKNEYVKRRPVGITQKLLVKK